MPELKSLYDLPPEERDVYRHTISLLVDNEFGVLSRVIGLFSSRGYNIDSLTVSQIDEKRQLSRITIVTHGSNEVIEQIRALVERLVPVHQADDLTLDSPHIERTLVLAKVLTKEEKIRIEAQKLADRFGARTIDSTPQSFVFELSDRPRKIDKFLRLLKPLGLVEIAKTGVTAISRGAGGMRYNSNNDKK